MVRESLNRLLAGACPSIRYRVRSEVLGEPVSSLEMVRLQELILQDAMVRRVLSSQQPDGWLGTSFHHAGGAEVGIRVLREKGVNPDHPVFAKALEAMSGSDETFARELLRVGRILDQKGLGGSCLIRAVVFAYVAIEDKPFVIEQIEKALEVFQAVLAVHEVSDIADEYNGKLVFKSGAKWPNIYHLRLLALTSRWRTAQNRAMIAKAVERLVSLSPIPYVLVRDRSQLIAPPAVFMDDFNPDMSLLDGKGWAMWLHRMEMLSRLGVVGAVPGLRAQVEELARILRASEGGFAVQIAHPYFTRWTAYTGLALENDWRSPQRCMFDLTFRSLLILHFSGLANLPRVVS